MTTAREPGVVRVATYNLYLGADLSLLFDATSAGELDERSARVAGQLAVTDFARRAPAVARVLAAERPDLVGLQEVTQWSVRRAGAEPVLRSDFLALLLDALDRAGTPYAARAVNHTFRGSGLEAPDEELVLAGGDVVLVRAGSGVEPVAERHGRFTTSLRIPTGVPGVGYDVVRGWSRLDVEVDGSPLRFVNTHLEAWSADVRAAQRDELLEAVADPAGSAVVVGDFNAPPEELAMPAPYVDAWDVAGGPGERPHLRAAGRPLQRRQHAARAHRLRVRARRPGPGVPDRRGPPGRPDRGAWPLALRPRVRRRGCRPRHVGLQKHAARPGFCCSCPVAQSTADDSAAGRPPAGPGAPPDPEAVLRSRQYIALLVLGAVVGAPVAAVAYLFLAFVSKSQTWVFSTLPEQLGFDAAPTWWPLLPLTACGVIVGLSLTYLRGTGGHEPAQGFNASGGPVEPADLPGIVVASLATLCLGAVLGPEAPLIAIGSGLGVLAVHLVKKDAPAQAAMVIGAAGSFAAISTLLGSPIVGAFLLMEAVGLGGPILGVVLLPGLLASGIGALIFVGLDQWTGQGTFSLALPGLPPFGAPTVVEFGYALVVGVLGAVLGVGIQRIGRALQAVVVPRRLLASPVIGFAVGAIAVLFAAVTDKSASYVLFSGQDQMPELVSKAASWSVGALVLLLLCKSVAYGLSLSAFRGGPVFPAIFVGATGGILLSSLPGLPMVAGVGIGVGAMTVAMLRMPMVSVLLPSLMLASDQPALMPLIIVAVVVSHVVTARLTAPAQRQVPVPAQ